MILALCLAVPATAWCYRMAQLTGSGVEPDGQEVVRHVLATACLAVAVLSQGAVLRAAGYPALAGLVPWLAVLAPTTVEMTATAAELASMASGAADARTVTWTLASYPLWPAMLTLLAADGIRSIWRGWNAVAVAAVVAALATATWWVIDARTEAWWMPWPGALQALRGWELGPLRAVLVAMAVCAALVAGSRMPAAVRWSLALGSSLPAIALAVLPTLLSAPRDLAPAQRWTVVIYPLAALAAATPAALLRTANDLQGRYTPTQRK